jgi:hypothetical protein
MLTFILTDDGQPTEVVTTFEKIGPSTNFTNRTMWKDASYVHELCTKLNEKFGDKYMVISTNFAIGNKMDIILKPQIGDEVSRAFNGDIYPCGTITHISKTMKKITTSHGTTFWRQGDSGCWRDMPWSMVPGHRYEQNPHL